MRGEKEWGTIGKAPEGFEHICLCKDVSCDSECPDDIRRCMKAELCLMEKRDE